MKATKTHPELVSSIGLCNFDAEHTEEACKYILEKTGDVGLVSNQVQVCYPLSMSDEVGADIDIQFSLIDSRPLQKMSAVCERYGIKLMTYGSFVSPAVVAKSTCLQAKQRAG